MGVRAERNVGINDPRAFRSDELARSEDNAIHFAAVKTGQNAYKPVILWTSPIRGFMTEWSASDGVVLI